ncbi:MAG TPA: hypothetical protein VH599_16850 [Ktedonobacterales bacterium]
MQRRRPGGRGLRGGVPVAPPFRQPALACWRRGPEGERSPWRSVEPPGRRRYQWLAARKAALQVATPDNWWNPIVPGRLASPSPGRLFWHKNCSPGW